MLLRIVLSGALALCLATPVLAQSSDTRVIDLEERIRDLNGRIEELNFQVLEMQDQIRRMQEDNELRFEQLEDGDSGGAASDPEREATESIPQESESEFSASEEEESDPQLGDPPRTFGTITFDEEGNLVSGQSGEGRGEGEPIDLLEQGEGSRNGEDEADASGSDGQSDAVGETAVAALPSTDDPEELYRNSYEFIMSGDYDTAEAGFRRHIERYPDDERADDSHFWLGEALLGQQRYRDAAEAFLRANREYPDSGKAPDMLLKLGVSLSAMDQRDVACATFTEIGERYPDASSSLDERVRQEQALAGC